MPEFADLRSVTVGDARITYLPDGGGIADPLATFPSSNDVLWSLHGKYLDGDGNFRTSIGGFLLQLGDRVIAVDTGIGPVELEFPEVGTYTGGRYLESLALAGVAPEDVTDVVFTHLHLDHCGWTTREVDGQRRLTFPNARHLVAEAEWEHWHGGDDPAGPHPEHVQQPLEGLVELFADGDELAPGLSVLGTPGHTPGHSSLVVASGGDRIILLADVMYGAVQVQEPDWHVAFDADLDRARESRRLVFRELLTPDTIGAAGHFADTVFGRMVGTGLGQVWVAL